MENTFEGKPERIDEGRLVVKTLGLTDRQDLEDLEELELLTYGRAAQNVWGLVPMIVHGQVFLARLDGEGVAWCIVNADWRDAQAAYIWSFAVAQKHHQRGIGTRLIAHVIDEVARQGRRHLEVVVSPTNARALHLARKAGFERAAVLPTYFGPNEDRWLMVKSIGS